MTGQEQSAWQNPGALAQEIENVLRAALAIARHYGIERQVRESIDASYRKLVAEGYLHELDDASG